MQLLSKLREVLKSSCENTLSEEEFSAGSSSNAYFKVSVVLLKSFAVSMVTLSIVFIVC